MTRHSYDAQRAPSFVRIADDSFKAAAMVPRAPFVEPGHQPNLRVRGRESRTSEQRGVGKHALASVAIRSRIGIKLT
jgi:hypothetical protein